ncbi:hypothetical protein S7335_907 [Synechococcus sp. PCC 7335]|uniref:hypothetical protein n=1 Tax=Synechococcus sp. (strain ATCC 29403 / PCC 7335) TaxID=91464 RepID=UPI00017EC4A0|nr:hypothetical protein [Synechococcus sp. PCC 7335]EDX82350.1 hypothetical protein S7335_907 [Synechococcus sp. PCC 7335]
MSDIHFINGEKGGVGKSFVCRTAIAYHLKHQLDFVAFETDRTNADVLRIYGEMAGVRQAIFSEGEEFDAAANAIFNTALSGQRVLVNLPAHVLPALSLWFEDNEIFEMADEGGVTLYNWFVSDGELDSLLLFEKTLDNFEDNLNHVFVANRGKTKKWELLTKNKPLMDRMHQLGVTVIRFPKFIGSDDCKRISQLSLPFEAVAEHQAFDAFGRKHVRSFLRKAFAQFDESGVFDDE